MFLTDEQQQRQQPPAVPVLARLSKLHSTNRIIQICSPFWPRRYFSTCFAISFDTAKRWQGGTKNRFTPFLLPSPLFLSRFELRNLLRKQTTLCFALFRLAIKTAGNCCGVNGSRRGGKGGQARARKRKRKKEGNLTKRWF